MSQRLNQSQTRQLILAAQQGDAQAMTCLVEDNLALVKYVVKRFQDAGRDWEDLYQMGCMGLVKAIRGFNPDFPVCFSTYAVPVILGEAKRFLRDDAPLRVARSIKENARRLRAFIQQSQAQTGRTPTLAEMAEGAGLSREDALLALESLRPTRSLSEPVGREGGLTLGDTLGEDRMEEVDRRLLIHQLLATLDDREREILVRRYFDRQTQSQIASAFGMTPVQVSRLESKLLKRLRETAQVTA